MRSREEYDSIVDVIIQIYIDYDFTLPLDLKMVCTRLGVTLIPFSECGTKRFSFNTQLKGFYIRGTSDSPPTIYYRDCLISRGTSRFTIAHELKHYVFNESSEDEADDELADYFARYILCPIPYLIVKGVTTADEIESHCIVSATAARNAASNILNRQKAYGFKIFDNEIPLLEHLTPVEFAAYKQAHYDPVSDSWDLLTIFNTKKTH